VETVSTLYILHRSLYFAPEIEDVIKLARAGDGIVLTQDAVLSLKSAPKEVDFEEISRKGLKLYALKADMDARSVKSVRFVEVIDYDTLIELLAKYDSTFS
jgi:sulfur relay protein TusB/DsrH